MKTLVIDDEPFVLKLLALQLANLGFTNVTTLVGASEALILLEEDESVGLILCDLQMPEMDGIEFVRHLMRVGYRGGLVLVSGENERILQTAEKLACAHKLNVLGTLHKPVSPEQLLKVLENHVPDPHELSISCIPHHTYGAEALLRAITTGELVNYYQPKVEIATGALVGVETLVRWQHPEDGLVLPEQFLSAVETLGLIDDLTWTVLSSALRQSRLWQDAGLSLHVAVNVSMKNLAVLDFPDRVAHEAEMAGVSLTSLVLEITESQLMKNRVAAMDIVTRLRLKRIGLSIDDFGTGHSSLAQLRDLPFEELKMDQGFVHGAHKDAALQAIIESNIELARHLGMTTVAEGIEDRDDWDFLRAAGCTLAQGYFIAHPMPADKLVDWMADWEIRRKALVDTFA